MTGRAGDYVVVCCQDLIGDWSPQDTVKRMQQGKVWGGGCLRVPVLCVYADCACLRAYAPGGVPGALPLPAGQNAAAGLVGGHSRRKRHHGGKAGGAASVGDFKVDCKLFSAGFNFSEKEFEQRSVLLPLPRAHAHNKRQPLAGLACAIPFQAAALSRFHHLQKF